MKDMFSGHASLYHKYRPGYPLALIEYILSFVPEKKIAWDCGTGNGQAAVLLAPFFEKVYASDISAAQLASAPSHPQIEYLECPVERTPLQSSSCDLISVAQAFHWFDWTAFHEEVRRVAKNNAVIAVWMYDRFVTPLPLLNQLVDYFYEEVTGPYWDERRKHVDDHYAALPFPYEVLPVPVFYYETEWSREQLAGYLSSWSAVQHFIRVNGKSPLSIIDRQMNDLMPGNKVVSVRFPIYLKMGRVKK